MFLVKKKIILIRNYHVLIKNLKPRNHTNTIKIGLETATFERLRNSLFIERIDTKIKLI